jgi:hypothetical protein
MRIAMTGLAFAASLLAAVPGSEAVAVERSGWSRFQDPAQLLPVRAAADGWVADMPG